MKKLGTTIFVLVITLLLVTPTQKPLDKGNAKSPEVNQNAFPEHIQSSISDTGESKNGTQFMSRTITDLNTSVLNTYANPDAHNGSIDISQYHIPGWNLYKADMNVSNVYGAPEREVAGSASTAAKNFAIEEHETGFYYNQLSQGFNLSQDGYLLNYSIYTYMNLLGNQLSTYGDVYLEIRREYDNASSIIVTSNKLPSIHVWTWYNVTPSSVLDTGHEYHIVMNGTDLSPIQTDYPTIYWGCETEKGMYESHKYDTSDNTWGVNLNYEAFLNYTYIPWNRTSDSVLIFEPENVSL
ncbi:MAG: hypothetical protein KGY80_13990, partial [Candidatus Thorarchaeota archaeon]|nr:hypothetical protein [Candidatus Thorarchaeota archaeon]